MERLPFAAVWTSMGYKTVLPSGSRVSNKNAFFQLRMNWSPTSILIKSQSQDIKPWKYYLKPISIYELYNQPQKSKSTMVLTFNILLQWVCLELCELCFIITIIQFARTGLQAFTESTLWLHWIFTYGRRRSVRIFGNFEVRIDYFLVGEFQLSYNTRTFRTMRFTPS